MHFRLFPLITEVGAGWRRRSLTEVGGGGRWRSSEVAGG